MCLEILLNTHLITFIIIMSFVVVVLVCHSLLVSVLALVLVVDDNM